MNHPLPTGNLIVPPTTRSRATAPGEPASRAGDCLRHPLIVLLLVVWILNDHLFKELFGNALTGKLSDFAGVAVFPLIPVALYEVACAWAHRHPRLHRPVLLLSLGGTALLMAGINLLDPWADALRVGLGAAQWPLRALWGLAIGGVAPEMASVHHTPDPTDLVSLLALGVPYWVATRSASSGPLQGFTRRGWLRFT